MKSVLCVVNQLLKVKKKPFFAKVTGAATSECISTVLASTSYYESLEKSPLPFNCSLCVHQKQAAMIEEMKSTITALTAEVRELRTALQAVSVRSQPELQ